MSAKKKVYVRLSFVKSIERFADCRESIFPCTKGFME